MNFLDMPMGSIIGRDRVVGKTEWGAPIYQSQLGDYYYEEAPLPPTDAENIGSILDAKRNSQPAPNYNMTTTRQAPEGMTQPGVMDAAKALWGMVGPGITAPGRALKGEVVTNGDTLATALDWAIPGAAMAAPEGALRSGAMRTSGIRAYHGSPHDFDKFSLDKIGTGEGAQAYGHGLYFAEAENTAKAYRDQLGGGRMIDADGAKYAPEPNPGLDGKRRADALKVLEQTGGNYDDARALMGETYDKYFDEMASRGVRLDPSGHMYEVNINANPDDFLDWDAPLSEQPQKIRDVLGPRLEQFKAAGAKFGDEPSGESLWKISHPQSGIDDSVDMSKGLSAQATDRLREAGIPGIKYKDAGSRGTEGGTRNYVVFDDNLIDIVRKYGLAGLTLGGAMSLGKTNQQDADTLRKYLGT